MGFFGRTSQIKFLTLLILTLLIITLVASTLGCTSLNMYKDNSSSNQDMKRKPSTPEANITFITTGSSFSPIITVTGNPEIKWVFGDGSTSDSASPTVKFGSKETRANTLVVTPWSAVTKINIGYDGSDGGVTPGPNTTDFNLNIITFALLKEKNFKKNQT